MARLISLEQRNKSFSYVRRKKQFHSTNIFGSMGISKNYFQLNYIASGNKDLYLTNGDTMQLIINKNKSSFSKIMMVSHTVSLIMSVYHTVSHKRSAKVRVVKHCVQTPLHNFAKCVENALSKFSQNSVNTQLHCTRHKSTTLYTRV